MGRSHPDNPVLLGPNLQSARSQARLKFNVGPNAGGLNLMFSVQNTNDQIYISSVQCVFYEL